MMKRVKVTVVRKIHPDSLSLALQADFIDGFPAAPDDMEAVYDSSGICMSILMTSDAFVPHFIT